MLIRYKKNLEKIAMGLLSFMPNEKDVKKLQATIKQYESLDDWQLFLWKEDDDIIGVIGIILDSSNKITIQHITVNPSFRYQGIGKKMLLQIEEMYSDKQIEATDLTTGFLEKCLVDEEREPK
ncbi:MULTISPECIES: GNAT family N-acetyltransferase [Bacillus]|uniref:GNAT family N-acetyltransferase n=1 Tax=Bacillus TaxID=1386 RepID=UPI0002EDD0B1|nr:MULTISPECIES: GNAT family N-acetyltransferase [Bacillus]